MKIAIACLYHVINSSKFTSVIVNQTNRAPDKFWGRERGQRCHAKCLTDKATIGGSASPPAPTKWVL